LWTSDRIDETLSNYNLSLAVKLSGSLDVEALTESFRDVILRHEPLRTLIIEDNGEPIGRILSEFNNNAFLSYADWCHQDSSDVEASD